MQTNTIMSKVESTNLPFGAGTRLWLCVSLFVCLLPAVAAAQSALPDGLQAALERLAHQNPQAAIHAATSRALQHRGGAVDSLPDPTLGFSLKNLPSDNPTPSGSTTSGIGIDLVQPLPSLGTLIAKGEALEKKASARSWQEVDAREKALAEGLALYVEAAAVASEIARLKKTITALKALRESAVARYRTGQGIRFDLDQIDVEISLVASRIDAATGRLGAVKSGWLPLAGDVFPDPLTWEGFSGWEIEQESLLQAVQVSPLVAVADARVQSADATERAARWKAFPDLALSGGVVQRPGGNDGAGATDLNFGLRMSLPIGYPWRQGEEVDAARADKSARTVARRLAALRVETRVRSQFALYKAARAEEKLYETRILPADRTALNSGQSAYEAGRADILIPIRAITTLYRDESALDRRRSKRIAAAGRALAATGELGKQIGINNRDQSVEEENK